MPTPFYHLSVAEELLEHPGLPNDLRHMLQDQRPAFLLGNTAPDVQTVSGQERQETHFFDLPIQPEDKPAWERMLSTYPMLARPAQLPQVQAAFIAGYLLHLQADWLWILEIFAPVFGPDNNWRTFSRRLYLHNVLRSYLDRQILAELSPQIGRELGEAAPQHWLTFVNDEELVRWRDLLAQQLQPEAQSQTVEIFARRQGISRDEFYNLLDSEESLEQEIFTRLPRQKLLVYRQRLVEENVQLLKAYFTGGEIPYQ